MRRYAQLPTRLFTRVGPEMGRIHGIPQDTYLRRRRAPSLDQIAGRLSGSGDDEVRGPGIDATFQIGEKPVAAGTIPGETVFGHGPGQASVAIKQQRDSQRLPESAADPGALMQMGMDQVGSEGPAFGQRPAVQAEIQQKPSP
jgi:hypothetical protein